MGQEVNIPGKEHVDDSLVGYYANNLEGVYDRETKITREKVSGYYSEKLLKMPSITGILPRNIMVYGIITLRSL